MSARQAVQRSTLTYRGVQCRVVTWPEKKKRTHIPGPIDCHGLSELLIPFYWVKRSFMYSWAMPAGMHTVEFYSPIRASISPLTTPFFGQRLLASQDGPDRTRRTPRSDQVRNLCCQLNISILGALRRETRKESTEPGQSAASTVGMAMVVSWF